MMMKRVRLYTGLMIAISLMGCNTSPPDVHAERPLVENVVVSSSEFKISDSIWSQLVNGPEGLIFDYKGVQVTLERRYTSALGYLCRNVYLHQLDSMMIDSKPQKRVVCQDPKTFAWVLVPQVIDNKSTAITFGH